MKMNLYLDKNFIILMVLMWQSSTKYTTDETNVNDTQADGGYFEPAVLDNLSVFCVGILKMCDSKDNLLWISWHDSAWIPILNPTNVMDYFQSTTNPFYDRTCNNEIVKMQRLNMEHLNNLTGLEYMLLHVQEPILYVIRKQHRHSATAVTPLADFYIIAGVVYQAPDLGSVINSRISTTVNHLQGAFDEARNYSRYHPSKGYWWEFKDSESKEQEEETKKAQKKSSKDKAKEESGSMFQRQRVNILLNDLAKKFPLKNIPFPAVSNQPETKPVPEENAKQEIKVEVKTEPVTSKPPPEKKPRLL